MKTPVILVDDDGVTRLRLTAMLMEMGYEVRAFSSGEAAWAAFQEAPTRIVISDWQMDGMDGTELCDRIRACKKSDYTYFLLITASDPGVVGYDYSIGVEVDDFLIKPVEQAALWRRLRVAERQLSFMTTMRQMEALLPICSYCHRIRDEQAHQWQSLEAYISQHTGSDFSHGVCPACAAKARA